MKTIILLLTTVISFTMLSPEISTSKKEVLTETLTFDAYEGGYFFFTDEQQKPLILVSDSQASISLKKLQANEVTGEKFKVKYKNTATKGETSNQGLLLHVILD